MRKLIKILIFFITLGLLSQTEANENIDWYNKDLVIKGEYLQALMVVEKDFLYRLNKKIKSIKNKEKNNNEKLTEYLSKMENYNIEIGSGNSKYIIWITPRLTSEFPVIFGGDAVYIIDSKTFKLLETQYGK
jgi:hypothetical protein